MTRDWPPVVWEAINRLAEADLANYPHHVANREKFLAKARAERVSQHASRISALVTFRPSITVEEIVADLNPAPKAKPDPLARTARAAQAMYERNDERREPLPDAPPSCELCANTGRLVGGCCGCERGQVVALIDRMRHKEPA